MTKEIIQKVSEIVELAVNFNSSETRQEITGNKPTFFVEFYGHICSLEVRVNIKGYCAETANIYLTGKGAANRYEVTILDGADKQTLQDLDTVLAEMQCIINKWEAAQ